MPDPSLVAEKTGPGGFQRSASLGAVQPYAGCVGRHGHAWRVVMPILRQSYANPVAASESDLVRVRVRGVRVRVWVSGRKRVKVRVRVSGQGQGSGWHAFESRRPLGGLLGRLLPQRVGEHAQRLELARRRRLGARKRAGSATGRGAGTPRIRAARPPPLLRPSLSSGSSSQAQRLAQGPWAASRERAWPHGWLRAGALPPSMRWYLGRITRAGVVLAARPLRRARVAPILVTLHKLEVVRLRTANEILLVEAQHPRLRCQRRRGGRDGPGRACRVPAVRGSRQRAAPC